MNKQTPTTLLKKITTLFVVLFVVCSTFGFSMPGMINAYAASVPLIITYQGRILNLAGVPVSDSSLSMKFELYSASSGGSCLWSNSSTNCDGDTPAMTSAKTITLTDGLFSESLGDTSLASPYAAIDETIFTTDTSIYLQVYVDGEELSPRKQLTSAPYAINADYLDGLDSTELQFFTDSGAVTYLTSATDDFAIGGTTANASPFGVDESANTVYIGEGSNSNGSIVFKASDADTGTLAYTTDDLFSFTGGDIDIAGAAIYPSSAGTNHSILNATGTFSTGASGGAGIYSASGIASTLVNSATEAVGISQILFGSNINVSNSSSGELDTLYGSFSVATNTSIAATPIASAIYGVYGQAAQNAAGVVPSINGVTGDVFAPAGTATLARAIYGLVSSSAGTLTTSIAGDFSNAAAGTTRYGVRSTASGGSANYSGYFYGAPLFVDSTSSPTTPVLVDGAGDLYVFDQLEVGGANQTDGAVIKLDTGTLTTGAGLQVRRANSGTEFTSVQGLVNFTIDDTGSTGNLLYLNHDGAGTSLYIDQVGDDTALAVNGTNTTDYIATFFNDGNVDTNMGISIQACADTNPTTACNLAVFKDGDGTVLGAIEGNGAGGVTNASSGSDYAELFDGIYSDFIEGDIIALDFSGEAILAQSSSSIIGAFSVAPNTLGNWVDGWQDTGLYVPVALLGQVPVKVNDSTGAIAVGDYITLSSTPGVGRRATGVGYVLGRALEAHTSGTGIIQVLVNPNWVAADVLEEDGTATAVNGNLKLTASGTATASTTGQNSNEFILRGSGWNGASASDIDMSIITKVNDSLDYGLSVSNNDGTEVAYISNEGNLAIAGRLYPSDRGTLQTDKYIYYDGSSGAGGDFMRTNASGWGAGSYDFAEMFPSTQILSAGEVVIFASNDESVQRSIGATYDDKIAGVISTQPGFLAGENLPGHVPVALAGRVPTYVSGENGDIKAGDPLTTSSKPGYAMKATTAGPVVGYAMESFSGNTGAITVFIRPSYYDGGDVTDAPGTNNSASGFASVSKLDLSGSVNLNGGSIASIGSLVGIGNNWKISEDGQFSTKGQFIHIVKSYQGEDIETYAALSRNVTIQLTGTAELKQGSAVIKFEDIDPKFNDIISNTQPYKVFLTANAPTNTLYAVNRSISGFQIKENDGNSSATVDWLVIAYHKDFEPIEVEKDVFEEIEVEVVNDVVAKEVLDDSVVTQEIVAEIVDVEEVVSPASDAVEEVVTEQEPVIEEEIIEELPVAEDIVETPAVIEDTTPELTADVPVEEAVSTADSTDIVVE